jgi:LSU ribosomal protein L4P
MIYERCKKARVFNTSGEAVGEIDLPNTFSEPYRPDIIKKPFSPFSRGDISHTG